MEWPQLPTTHPSHRAPCSPREPQQRQGQHRTSHPRDKEQGGLSVQDTKQRKADSSRIFLFPLLSFSHFSSTSFSSVSSSFFIRLSPLSLSPLFLSYSSPLCACGSVRPWCPRFLFTPRLFLRAILSSLTMTVDHMMVSGRGDTRRRARSLSHPYTYTCFTDKQVHPHNRSLFLSHTQTHIPPLYIDRE